MRATGGGTPHAPRHRASQAIEEATGKIYNGKGKDGKGKGEADLGKGKGKDEGKGKGKDEGDGGGGKGGGKGGGGGKGMGGGGGGDLGRFRYWAMPAPPMRRRLGVFAALAFAGKLR